MASEFQALHVFHFAHGLAFGVDQSGTVGVKIHHFNVIEFFGVKFLVNAVDDLRGDLAIVISQGQIHGRHDRKTPPGVGEDGKADVRQPLYRSIVTLLGLGKRSPREIIDGDLSVGPFFDLLAPGFGQLALYMTRREKIAVGEFDGTGLGDNR